jgi:hypothetical protein
MNLTAIHRPDALAGYPKSEDVWTGPGFGWFRDAIRHLPRPVAIFRSASFWGPRGTHR